MTKRLQIALVGGLALLAMMGVFYFAAWAPTAKSIKLAKAQDATLVSQQSSLQSQLAQLRAAAKNIGAKKAELARIQSAIPAAPNVAQFILQIDAAATASGFQFLTISPQPLAVSSVASAAVPGGPTEVRLSITGTGTFFKVLDFLHRVQSLPRVMVVDKVSISPGGASTGTSSSGGVSTAAAPGNSPDLALSISGRMFTTYVPPIKPVGTLALPGSKAS